jgi:hypothetical protein
MSKRKQPIGKTREQDVALWDDLPITGDLLTDITIFLRADMCCGPNGCAQDASVPLLKRARKEISSLRRQLLARERP